MLVLATFSKPTNTPLLRYLPVHLNITLRYLPACMPTYSTLPKIYELDFRDFHYFGPNISVALDHYIIIIAVN